MYERYHFKTITEATEKVEYQGEQELHIGKPTTSMGLEYAYSRIYKGLFSRSLVPKGHIVYCLKARLQQNWAQVSSSILIKVVSYVVSDELSSHRSITIKMVLSY
jgi:hypothetical protein